MSGTGLSSDAAEYRRRLDDQSDETIDAFAAELMRDLSIRQGVIPVLETFRRTARLGEREIEHVFAAGGGAPATLGRTATRTVMVPAISLHHLIPGLRASAPDARGRLTDYLVDNFHEIVFL